MELHNPTSFTLEKPENIDLLTDAYNRMAAVYDIAGDYQVETRSLAGYMFRKFQLGHVITDESGEVDWSYYGTMLPMHAVNTTKYIQSAVSILKDEYDVDILSDRRALSDNPKKSAVCIEDLRKNTGLRADGVSLEQASEEDFGRVFALDIANLFSGNRQRYRNGIQATERIQANAHDNISGQLVTVAQLAFYREVVDNPSSARYEAHKQLQALCSDDMIALVDYGEEVVRESYRRKEQEALVGEILQSKKQELDYTILPAGTELREVAEQIANESSEYTKAHIDLERLAVLEKVRQRVGPEKCFLMRGKSSGKNMTDTDGTLINEDYIGLIMQHHDDYGNVVREDCLAVSPIARKHAGYIVRQDASEGISWREILALPKQEAIQYFNARRLRFDPVAGQNKYDAYVEKVDTLLSCDKEQFDREYVLRRSGETYKMVHRGNPLGSLGLRAALQPSSM
jgi:hypothetical protein